jgi:hypothetical protein
VNPQTLNRFSYVYNSPINFVDPSGHCGTGKVRGSCFAGDGGGRISSGGPTSKLMTCSGGCLASNSATRGEADRCNANNTACLINNSMVEDNSQFHIQSWWYWVLWEGRDYYNQDCTSTLLECYYASPLQLMKFQDRQAIDPAQFNALIIAVYIDIKSMDQGWPIGSNNYLRLTFDMPFFNGFYLYRDELLGGATRKIALNDTTVCIEGYCSSRSDINYFAQGMWGAASGQTLDDVYADAEDWKKDRNASLSVDAQYWIKFGYDKYNEFDEANLMDDLMLP